MNVPKTRNENIVIQEMEKEILIYDLKDNKAFCLNETSAIIYQLCDGKRTISEINNAVAKKLNQSISEDLIWLALNDFKRDNLLEDNSLAINFNGLSRRQIIKKVGFASMIALPFVSSVIAPQAVQAGSCVGIGQPCSPHDTLGGCCFGQGYCDINFVCIPCTPPNGLAIGAQVLGGFPNVSNIAGCSGVADCQVCYTHLRASCCSGQANHLGNGGFCTCV